MDNSAYSSWEILSDSSLELATWILFYFFIYTRNPLRTWHSWVGLTVLLVALWWPDPLSTVFMECLPCLDPPWSEHSDQVLQRKQDQPLFLGILERSCGHWGRHLAGSHLETTATKGIGQSTQEQFYKCFLYNTVTETQLRDDGCRAPMLRKCH